MGRLGWWGVLVGLVCVLLISGCRGRPAYRILSERHDQGFVEVEVLTRAGTAPEVSTVIQGVFDQMRRKYQPVSITLYLRDTEIFLGVIYDVAVAYWRKGDQGVSQDIYLRAKIKEPGSVPEPGEAELRYFGINHKLMTGRPDLVTGAEFRFYQKFVTAHSEDELHAIFLKVQRWVYQ